MTDTPDTSRAALEALANWHDLMAQICVREDWPDEANIAASHNHQLSAATLRALAARAEPPADVAALVEEARQYAGKAARSADAYRETRRRELAEEREEVADLVSRLAAALSAHLAAARTELEPDA